MIMKMNLLQKSKIFLKPQHRLIVFGSLLIALILLGFVLFFSDLSHKQSLASAQMESANLV